MIAGCVGCPKCGKRIKLSKSGLLWEHREPFAVDPRYRPKICSGSGEPPYRPTIEDMEDSQ